ncbi:MAG: hypothetical protein QNK05_01345 [Myxococcota bacterium]|nr:hypothetical protein [Myxococcota bacterium]
MAQTRTRRVHLLALLPLALALGCGSGEPATQAEPSADQAAREAARAAEKEAKAAAKTRAKEVFVAACTECHGTNGAGNGSRSAELVPRPRNFQDPNWQREVDDAFLAKIIVEGGEAVGRAASMPPNPELANEPLVVDALVKQIRGFGY